MCSSDLAGDARLAFLARCRDGFAIAEEDLRRRGMGDLAGLRQAGENLEGLGAGPGGDGAELEFELVRRARERVRSDLALLARYLGEAAAAALV